MLVEAISDYAVFLLDTDGIVTSWNLGGERIKGYRAEEIVGQHFSCFYTEEERRNGKPLLALKAAAETGRFEEEGIRLRKTVRRSPPMW